MGAWIEIISAPTAFDESVSSLPSWERGLKSYYQVPPEVKSASLPSWERGLKFPCSGENLRNLRVAPLVGAWIEIQILCFQYAPVIVAPLVGAWIEILM